MEQDKDKCFIKKRTYDFAPIQATQNSSTLRIRIAAEDRKLITALMPFHGIDKPIHVVWGIPRDATSPAVLVTAYRPDPERWSDDFRRRKV
jgi:hypothetical protein